MLDPGAMFQTGLPGTMVPPVPSMLEVMVHNMGVAAKVAAMVWSALTSVNV